MPQFKETRGMANKYGKDAAIGMDMDNQGLKVDVYRADAYAGLGYINSNEGNIEEAMRLYGGAERIYKKAIEELGLVYDENIVENKFEEKNGNEDGYNHMKKILEKATPTAVFSSNDLATAGVMMAISQRGLKIPQDISVLGCGDDFDTLAYMNPPLTTFAMKKGSVGEFAVKRLLDRIKNPDASPVKILVPFQLIERESCSKI